MANNNKKSAQCEGGDLSQVNQVIELEAEKPRRIMIEVKVKDMSLLGDEDDRNNCGEDGTVTLPISTDGSSVTEICPDASSITEIIHVWTDCDPEPDNISITIADPSPSEVAGGSGLASLSETCNEANASFKRLLGQWVPQNDEKPLRQHFYKYGPPPPVMPLPVAPNPSTELPIDRPAPDEERVPEDAAIPPENECENNGEVMEKPSKATDVLELEKALIRSYNRLDPSKIKTFL